MSDLTPQAHRAVATQVAIAHERAMTRRALAARDADITPEMRRARALDWSMVQWDRLLGLAGGRPALAAAAERRLEQAHGDAERALSLAIAIDGLGVAEAERQAADRAKARLRGLGIDLDKLLGQRGDA